MNHRAWAALIPIALGLGLASPLPARAQQALPQSPQGPARSPRNAAPSPPTPGRPEELKLGPLQFTPPAVERVKLPCGIPVFLAQSHDFPICDLVIEFRMGTRYLPADRHTASEVLGSVWGNGGTLALRPDTLEAILAADDATITSFGGALGGGVTVSLAAQDLDRVLPLWRDVVLHPRFDPDRVEKAKADHLKDLQAINNDPGQIADERMKRLVLGRDYPTSRYETRADCEAVTRADLVAIHRLFVRRNNAFIGVSGDFDRKQMLARLERLFHDWPDTSAAQPARQAWAPHPEPGVYLLSGDYEQSQIRIGRIIRGLSWSSADYPGASILSFAFGYGRVFYRARAEGLSYGATIMLRPGEDFTTETGFGSCRGEVTLKLLHAMLAETDSVKARPLSDAEVETSRTFQIGNVVRSIETPADVVRGKVDQVVDGEPAQEQYLNGLRTSTGADLRRLTLETIVPRDSLVVLVLGNPKSFDAPLDSLGLGPVKELQPVSFGE